MRRCPRLLAAILFVFALALRAWVPAGWMPTPGAHSLAIMPCPAADAPTIMDMGHGSRHHDHSNSECFSPLLAGVALPDPPVTIAAPSPAPVGQPAAVAAASFTRSAHDPRPHSTGPPEIA
jgi:hypothetical protein